ncbi:hypothetical protein [Aliikangiella sp. G2MR2-5]|uniref:hypothetical protein n=1 Tax=Aliikangiella sp. G2MR2-5 TaxID=2788943 RepID=UPI0018ABFB8B|nr:hypothetical protein [Aliikangiella sp. G2MR2-5]
MLVQLVKYISSLLAGFVIGYMVFGSSIPTSTSNELYDSESITKRPPKEQYLIQEKSKLSAISKNMVSPSSAGKTTDTEEKLRLSKEKILQLEKEIEKLKWEVAALTPEEEKAIRTITMDEFENQMKSHFQNRFRGLVIQLGEDQMKSIKEDFEKVLDKAEWNSLYESRINQFIRDNDSEGLHFVDEFRCNSRICKLSVNSNDENHWNRLYLSLTKQEWFQSMTISEGNDVVGRLTYYITSPKSFD